MIADPAAGQLRAALAHQLAAQGLLGDPGWREAFEAVPREVFVPCYFQPCRGRVGWRLLEGGPEWRQGVYTDAALVTQLNGSDDALEAARRGEAIEGTPTSSSSAPSLMAAMLGALDTHHGHRVLEVGTGSGYNAALLAHRLGDTHLTTIDVDPALCHRAHHALATIGRHPRVICADGAQGITADQPYDRVISTVAFTHVPPAWLTHTRPGALILIPLRFAGHGGLMALLTRGATGQARGRFLSHYGGFMAVRNTPEPARPTIRSHLLDHHPRPTDVPPEALTDAHPAAFYLSLRCPSPYTTIQFTPDDGSTGRQTWGQGADGSTFTLIPTDATTTVTATGPLWDTLEGAYTEWHDLGQPARDRFGVTAGTQQWVWLDNPDNLVTELHK